MVKMVRMKCGKCPTDVLSLTNRVVVHSADHRQLGGARHVAVQTGPTTKFLFTLEVDDGVGQVRSQGANTKIN